MRTKFFPPSPNPAVRQTIAFERREREKKTEQWWWKSGKKVCLFFCLLRTTTSSSSSLGRQLGIERGGGAGGGGRGGIISIIFFFLSFFVGGTFLSHMWKNKKKKSGFIARCLCYASSSLSCPEGTAKIIRGHGKSRKFLACHCHSYSDRKFLVAVLCYIPTKHLESLRPQICVHRAVAGYLEFPSSLQQRKRSNPNLFSMFALVR